MAISEVEKSELFYHLPLEITGLMCTSNMLHLYELRDLHVTFN